jgi:glycosyltransferase involved in cell wall biosynthesis
LTALATAYFIEAVYAGHRLRKAGITHVHCHFTTHIGLLLGRVFDIGLSMTIHGPDDLVDPEGFQLGEKVRVSRFVSAISYFGKSQIMLYSSPKDWYKLEVTPLGIDIAGWRAALFREAPAPFELISVGRLVKVKGYPVLLDALALLVSQDRNVRLTLVGDGQDRSDLEKQANHLGIADRVTFMGWRTQEELHKFYQNSDLFVLSSFAEGIPVVLMEAMASGVPCVAPRIVGIPELIRDHIEGLLVTPSHVDELVTAIAELMDSPSLRHQMAKLCRERIAEKYELRKNALHLSEVFCRWIPNLNDRRLA